ncbi:hypothetical protein H257_08184 [Aphanomyces astaci]|uniref:RING-type domain-containing protein n=1 Tax=Aphanomyces astaci TaxID=112090 RepID=W4GFU3_APHAT|nr:hypothetical protein H257_08184 [Aphanomyces astaci]ETV77944.1 hypothetical protein H257_08184 [Aphanomyces astaci]|eukprot:XP_009832281.1 hypothetical protein H257_08184 [Aphanomyces astaci]
MTSSATSAVECAICYDTFYFPFVTSCGHAFCHQCLTDWTSGHRQSTSCPLCRSPIPRVDGEPRHASLHVERYLMLEVVIKCIDMWSNVFLVAMAAYASLAPLSSLWTPTVVLILCLFIARVYCMGSTPVLLCGMACQVHWRSVLHTVATRLLHVHNMVYSRHIVPRTYVITRQ